MEFCEKCRGIMIPAENGMLRCKNCSYLKSGEIVSKEKIKKKTKIQEGVVEHGNIFANFEHVCKKCGHDKCQIVERQPFISDEDTLLYVKCGKCGYSENLSRKIM